MTALTRSLLARLSRRRAPTAQAQASQPQPVALPEQAPVEIAHDDPLLAYVEAAGEAVDVDALDLDSPALRELKAAGVRLAVPLVSQGELIGVLSLGPRLSEQDYSSDDRKLLHSLAGLTAPALRVGQLVREQQAAAATRQRYEQELEIARLIQQNFLPKELPDLDGWDIAAYYRPAREVGGDFYDVIPLPDGRIGFVVGDVTDKGVPAALVMSATRTILRATATRLIEPGAVLGYVNDHLCPDMPERMFVTCLYGVLEPATGLLRFANAGHDVPYVKTASGVVELRARGMPLGLLAGMSYEEKEMVLAHGDGVLMHSDGIVEAHTPEREMYGFPRLKETVGREPGGQRLIELVLADLDAFIGPDGEQEDDITMLTLVRVPVRGAAPAPAADDERVLDRFELPSRPGNERLAIERVELAVAGLGLGPRRLERLKTAVGEATMNAIEHGNENVSERPVGVCVLSSAERLRVRISDLSDGGVQADAEAPDLEAKLEGRQSPRGWGLFLIERMVDETRAETGADGHTLELVLNLKGAADGDA